MDETKRTEERDVLKDAVESLDAPSTENKPESAPQIAETPAGEKPASASGEAAGQLPDEEMERLTNDIVAALKTVHDPEIPADIYELGLIYKVEINDDREVAIDMTLTAPGCPVAGEMPQWVENAVNAVPGVLGTKVKIVFDPPWDPSRMSDEARLAVGMF